MSVSLNQSPKTIMNARVNAQYYRKQRGWIALGGIVHRVRRVKVEMRQTERGEWQMRVGDSESWIMPTDIEVSLWLDLEECKHASAQG